MSRFVSAIAVLLLTALAANVHAAEVKITAIDGATGDGFGVSVAISGDYAVVGAGHGDGTAPEFMLRSLQSMALQATISV